MRIVIVGGGVGGLSTYLFLQKELSFITAKDPPLEIMIYESHKTPKKSDWSEPSLSVPSSFVQGVGGVLGISPNGVRVLKQLDEDLFPDVVNHGYPVKQFNFRNCYGKSLAKFPTTNFADPPLHTILISRQALWDALRNRIPDSAILCKRVSGVTPGTTSQRPRIQFADGSSDEVADLIIGADGVRSVVKRAVTGDGNSDAYPAIYEGLVGVGGFMPSSYLPADDPLGTTTMTFGPDGFFGYGACSTAPDVSHDAISTCAPGPQAVWWSTYSLKTPPPKDGINKDDIVHQLQNRHASWKDPVIQKVIQEVRIDSIYPTWTTPNLPTWERDGVVLVGDAAHALQTSSGQGVSQALEDAEMLGMLIAKHLRNGLNDQREALQLAAKSYCKIRMPRVRKISDYAKRLGDMKRKKGFIGERVMYLFMWLGGKLPRDSNSRWLHQYDPKAEIEKHFLGQAHDAKAG